MAYNDKRLKTDLEGKPIPQAYNPAIDDYEPVHSTNNALHQVIYGPNGQPISTVGNKLAVRATELEALMQGFATEGKLEQVRQLLAGVATEAKLEQVKSELELVKSELQTIKANQLSGDQKVQLSGTDAEPVNVQLLGELQIMDWIFGIGHVLGPGETYKTGRLLNASRIQSDIATIVVAGQFGDKRDIDVYVSMKPSQAHETGKMLVYSSLEDAVPQATHVFNIVLQYPEFYLHVTNRSSSTFTVFTILLVGRGVR